MSNEYPVMARVIEEKINLYAEARLEAAVRKEVEVGDIIFLGKTIKNNGKQWVETRAGDERGFIAGEAKVWQIKKVKLNQNKVNVYDKPSLESVVKEKYNKNTVFYMTHYIKMGDKEWVKIHDLSNNVGFIDANTLVQIIEPLPDIKTDLGGWGIGLIVLGVISNLIPNFLSAYWGIVIIILGIVILAFRSRVMYILLGAALFVVGLMNIIPGNSGWVVFGFFQLYWGVQEIQKFWKYKKLEEKGKEDQDVLLNIERQKFETADDPHKVGTQNEAEIKYGLCKEKSRVEIKDGIWTCPECGVRSRADSEICDECGQAVILE